MATNAPPLSVGGRRPMERGGEIHQNQRPSGHFNKGGETGMVEEISEEEFADFEAERTDRLGIIPPIVPGAPSVWIDPNDPLFTDRDRILFVDRQLRWVRTAEWIAYLLGFMQLEDSDPLAAVRGKGLRRLVQVYPPKFIVQLLPIEKRFLELVVPEESLTQEEKYGAFLAGQWTYGEHNQDAGPGEGSLPPELIDKGRTIALLDQRFWVFSTVKTERFARGETGFYKMPWGWIAMRWRNLLEPQLSGAAEWNGLSAITTLAQARQETARVYFRHRNCWQAFTTYRQLKNKKALFAGFWRPIQFNTRERYSHMEHARWLVEKIPWLGVRAADALQPEYAFTQTAVESINAEEELLDMFSTVLGKPQLRVYPTIRERIIRGGVHREVTYRVTVRRPSTELVIFASADECNDARKTVDHRKQWLGGMRRKAYALLDLSDVTRAPDYWYFGAADDQPLSDLIFAPINRIHPRLYLGYLWELAQDYAQRTGDSPLNYRVRPAPETGGWHLRAMAGFFRSFATLLEMAEYVRSGGVLTDKAMRENWLPKLVQFPKELICWTYWETKDGRPTRPHLEPGPGREPHAVPYRDFALWYDWDWVMRGDHYVFPQLVAYVNQRFEEAGLPVRVTFDGPDSNYFRHHDIAWEIWRNQPANPLIQRLKVIWNREVAKKTVHIRPVLYREVISDLPDELIADLSTPDRLIIEDLVATTEAELARLPRGATEERKKLSERLKRLVPAWWESKKLDPFTRFVQKLNRMSDRRFRLWAGFQSHGTKGGIMGFQISEAVSVIKEGYASDTGFPDTENTENAIDLISLAWQNGQFTKAVYLARGLAYLIAASVDPLRRHEAIASAIIGGLHQDIANHVAEGFGGLTEFLSLRGEAPAARYVKDVFESHEIKRLGRGIVKEIMEELKYRREMDRMKV